MLDAHFVILGAACSLLGAVLYARDTLKGVTQPNRVTWLLWGFLPLVIFFAEIQSGVGLQSLLTLAVGVGPLLVFTASFANRRSVWRIGALDYTCGVLSLAGLGLWLVTREGIIAIAASIAADALAAAPTLRKGWLAPETESANSYLGAGVGAVITLLTVRTLSAAEVAFPAYLAVMTSLELVLVVLRPGPRRRSRPAGYGAAMSEEGAESEASLHPNAARVQSRLAAAGSGARVRQLSESTGTSAEAAAALGVSVDQIGKSLAFVADSRPVVAVLSGSDRLDTAALAALLGASDVRRPKAAEVKELTGYPIGGVSPIALPEGVTVVVDDRLAGLEVVWVAAGTPNTVFPTTFAELEALTGARTGRVREG